MADLQTAEILQRLANLEQQNFRYRLAGVGLAVLILAAFLMGQSKPNVAQRRRSAKFRFARQERQPARHPCGGQQDGSIDSGFGGSERQDSR